MPRVPGNLSDAIRRILAGPVFDRQPRPPTMPSAPLNRELKEGEMPCGVCGSGRADHDRRDHVFTRVRR